jgi:hypothetical protein
MYFAILQPGSEKKVVDKGLSIKFTWFIYYIILIYKYI